MKNKEDIVVTGIGTLTPIGLNKDDFWKNLISGVSGAAPIQAFTPEGFSTTIACELKDFKASDFMDKKNARKMSRFSQIAVCASLEAVKDAHLDLSSFDPVRAGCIMGSAAGDYEVLEKQFAILTERGPGKGHPLAVPRIIPNMAAGNVAIELGLHGPNMAALSACATGIHSIASAMHILRLNQADVMIAGGTESTITPLVVDAYGCMRVLSTRNEDPRKASRPFDRDRDGFVIGEGAAALVLEKRGAAEKRGARIYACLAGVGMTADASSIAAPDENGRWSGRAMELAIADADLTPGDIGYINAHGTSTQANDKTESRAIQGVFGERSSKIPVSSNKSMIGHTLGAAGAIETAATILSLYNGIIPPTINQETPDPDCPLDTVPNQARELRFSAALTNSFGFGGQNAVLAIKGNN
ncbi:beta-ketoacyl-[acyl-carrier-protein] synthase II [Oceanispirochaeta crateris]|uniref:3-oxoacyl-[acyl-carrier-protein] synthase 2 n=1 Tax=Oceanispirochaeta crateris TaxID=2518645 RepID=A0A5C1QIT4_9SPIO|nr:beta-ketoacyl-ACP synthase II [Oceanispirochaeta crateris]QEN06454.1 beta-ketoacyl-[acyl-carrier-protein] synthase II [Oceanispirochaeta crateris]